MNLVKEITTTEAAEESRIFGQARFAVPKTGQNIGRISGNRKFPIGEFRVSETVRKKIEPFPWIASIKKQNFRFLADISPRRWFKV